MMSDLVLRLNALTLLSYCLEAYWHLMFWHIWVHTSLCWTLALHGDYI